ncbi:MAG: ABC transporter permease [Candidatus Omnitrophota bacterium]|jgi:ABC-2 type transport system permease protein|nr:MAG: ABC transporter permease [Candidatus Omnitrophota bacterium]
MKFNIRNVALVAQREIRQTMGKKGFLVALILPILLLALICSLVPLAEKLLNRSQNLRTESVKIGVIGNDADIIEKWRIKLDEEKLPNGRPLFSLESLSILGISRTLLEQNAQKKVRDKEWNAYVVFSGDITQNGKCDFYTSRGFDLNLPYVLSRSLREVIRNQRLLAEGLDPQRINLLNRGITWNEFELSLESKPTSEKEETKKEGTKRRARFEDLIGPAMICILMMFFLTFGTSQMLLRGIVEEKTSRVIELLLSSLSPGEIYTGKISGFFFIGLSQFAFWVGCGIVMLPWMDVSVMDYVPPIFFMNYLIFMTTGYLFYATIFAAIGAIVTDENESQQFQIIFNITSVIPMMMYFVFISQPNWWVVRLISFIPFFSHSVMALRMVAAPIPWWDILLVALSSLTFAMLGIFLAARIFRIGILMTGKRPSLREIGRWCFYRETEGVIET